MRRIRCPDCERNLKIPDEFQRKLGAVPAARRSTLRTPKWFVMRTVPERPRKRSLLVKTVPNLEKPAGVRSGTTTTTTGHEYGNGCAIRGLIPLAIILPLGLVLLVLAPFYKEAARAGL